MAIIPLTAKTLPSSRTKLLDNILSCTDYYAKLFVNEIDESDLQFTEASFLGYNQIKLDKDNWRDSIIESDFAVSYYKYPVAWSSSSLLNIVVYGYYIVDSYNTVVWYQKFSSPVVLSKDRGLNITPKIVFGCLPTPTPTATFTDPTPTPTPTVTPTGGPSLSFFGHYFNILSSQIGFSSQSQESLVVKIYENYKSLITSNFISHPTTTKYLLGKVVKGSKPYNLPWNFYIDENSIQLIDSDSPPNENLNLSPMNIYQGLMDGSIEEFTEVCYDFVSSDIKEMELTGIYYCSSPLIWNSRKEFDSNTNDYIQFGYCEGNCPQDLSKITEGAVEMCPDLGDGIDVQKDSEARLKAAYLSIYEYIQNEYRPTQEELETEILNYSFSEEETQEFEETAIIARSLDIENIIKRYRDLTPTPTPTIGGS